MAHQLTAGQLTVADVYAAAAGRLTVMFAPLAGWSPWPIAPPDATGLPAVWCELVTGGGTNYDSPTLRPLVLRVVAVPNPAAANPDRHMALAEAIDTLDAGYAAPLDPGVITAARTWTIDAVELGGADYEALLYDLALSYTTC